MKKTTFGIVFLLLTYLVQAQSVSGYLFEESTEPYVAVAGTSSTATGDDGTQDNIPIGFVFPFGGVDYSSFSISVNGFIRLGNGVAGDNYVNIISNDAPQKPFIAAFWDDHNLGSGTLTYALNGTAPNQSLEIGWDQINLSSGEGTSEEFFGSFKLRLYESTGVIELIYGSVMDAAGDFSASVGINDETSFISITPNEGGAFATTQDANNEVNSSEWLLGKKYAFTPIPACSGIPGPGATIASSAMACPYLPLMLTVENLPAAYGFSYQWQSSADGETFSDIENEQSSVLSVFQQENTNYQLVVSCGNFTAVSTPLFVEMDIWQNCYCVSPYGAGKIDGDLISNVSIAGTTLSNDSGIEAVNPSYTHFTGEPNYTAELQVGGVYQLSVTVGTYGEQNQAVWIDYNDDTFFTQNERVGYSSPQVGGLETSVFNIQLSCNAVAGLHRMRIRDVWNTTPQTILPCEYYDYGETEDYDITIVEGEPCPLPFGLSIGSYNSSSAQLKWMPGCGQSAWKVSVVPAGEEVGENVYEGVNSPFIVFSLEQETAYDFYVMADCGENGTSGWAGPFSFTTLPLAVANDDCQIAFPLQVGQSAEQYAITATNVGATKTLGEPNVSCANFAFGGDVWFSIEVPESGNVTIQTQLDAGSDVSDTGLSAYTGSCGGGLTSLGCSDDAIGLQGFSRLELSGLAPGTTIYARAWEYANDSFGTFRVSAWNTQLGLASPTDSGLRVYPNPVRDILRVSYTENISALAVYNLLGQQLLDKEWKSPQGELDMSMLPAGNYLVKITAGENSRTIKVIKQ